MTTNDQMPTNDQPTGVLVVTVMLDLLFVATVAMIIAAVVGVPFSATARAEDPPTQKQAIENLEQLLVEYDEGTLNAPLSESGEPSEAVSLLSLRAEITALRAENEALREQNEELRLLCPAPMTVPDPVPATMGPWLP